MTKLLRPCETPFAQTCKLHCRLPSHQSRGGNSTFESLNGSKIRSGAEPFKGEPVVTDPVLRLTKGGFSRIYLYQARLQTGLLRFECGNSRVSL